jgi:hypothetical protein
MVRQPTQTDHGKPDRIDTDGWQDGNESVPAAGSGRMQIQHHNGDDDCHYGIAKELETVLHDSP